MHPVSNPEYFQPQIGYKRPGINKIGTIWEGSPLILHLIFRLKFKGYQYLFKRENKIRSWGNARKVNFNSGWDSAQNRIPNEINNRIRTFSVALPGNKGWFVNNFLYIYLNLSSKSRIYSLILHCSNIIRRSVMTGCVDFLPICVNTILFRYVMAI